MTAPMSKTGVDPKLLEILVCPLTKGPLEYDAEAQELISRQAGLAYPDPRRHPDHAGRRGAPVRRLSLRPSGNRGTLLHPTPAAASTGRRRSATSGGRKTPGDRFRQRGAVFLSGRVSAGRKPLGRGPGPQPERKSRSSPGDATSASWRSSRSATTRCKIKFDDLHDTGIFSWAYLYRLGEEQSEIWAAYLAELEKRGLSRDPGA